MNAKGFLQLLLLCILPPHLLRKLLRSQNPKSSRPA